MLKTFRVTLYIIYLKVVIVSIADLWAATPAWLIWGSSIFYYLIELTRKGPNDHDKEDEGVEGESVGRVMLGLSKVMGGDVKVKRSKGMVRGVDVNVRGGKH
jgi:hypothetical protein